MKGMNKMTKKITVLAIVLAMLLSLAGCGGDSDDPTASPTPTPNPELEALLENTISATITLEDGDEINLELYPDLAPETVENFIELAEDGFYDGTIFHRGIPGFMIQGGGYDEDLNEQKASSIDGEFASNGFKNDLSHTRGVISMARIGNDPDSASSQFFIMHEDAPYLDGEYAAFGRVKDAMSLTVVDDIASVRTGSVMSMGFDDVPVTPIVIKSITIAGSGSSASGAGSKKSSPSPTGKTSTPKPTGDVDDDEDSDEVVDIEDMTEDEFQALLDSFDAQIENSSSSSSGSL